MGGEPEEVYAIGEHKIRHGVEFDKWPFRLDIPVEYQDWIIVAMCLFLLSIWTMPCYCSRIKTKGAKGFTNWVYTRMHVFYCSIVYITLLTVMFTIAILPDWTIVDFMTYLYDFVIWVLAHLQKMVVCATIMIGFYLLLSLRKRLALAAGIDHITLLRWGWRDILGFNTKKRPVEVFVWKVEGLKSASRKVLKANDIFIECHLGDNEPMRTRVHNNAGSGCSVKESFQLNIDESADDDLMTLCVCDQAMLASSEIGRLSLSIRELCGIEDQTGKRRIEFTYCEECFVALSLSPQGKIWIAIAPVEEAEADEGTALLDDDDMTRC